MKTLILVAACVLLVSFKSTSPSVKIVLYPSSYSEYREALRISSDTTFDENYTFEINRAKRTAGNFVPLKAEFICCKTGIKLGEFFKHTMVTSKELRAYGSQSMRLSNEISRLKTSY